MADQARSGQLEKLLIKAYSAPDYSSDSQVAEFRVAFNPAEYSWVYDVDYTPQQGHGTTGSPVVFRRIKPQEYKLRLLLDGTGVADVPVDVHDTIQNFFHVIGYDGEIHRPRYLQVIWGKLCSRCVLMKAEVAYKLFRPDGTPLRATIDASFTENVDDKTRVRRENKSSPDVARVKIVKDGDTLPLLCHEVYGDFAYYLQVAQINLLNDFRRLQPGTRLVFPPMEKTANA